MWQRFLCLYFPRLTVDRLEREDQRRAAIPFAVVWEEKGHLYIAAANDPAREAGVRPGARLADARALLPTLHIVLSDFEADERLKQHVVEWCDRYSPLAAHDGADGIALDITGCAHLFGGEAALLEQIQAGLREMKLRVRGAIADTPAAAWALARFSKQAIVSREELSGAIDPLPVRALRIPAEIAVELGRVGLTTIGLMRRVPRDSLAARYGPNVLLRLDRALGLAMESITPYRAPVPYRTGRIFAEPIGTTAAVEHVVLDLLTTLCTRLEKEQRGACRFDLACHRVDGGVAYLGVRTSKPGRSITHLMRLFAEKMNTLDAGFGIEVVTLSAADVSMLAPVQMALPQCGESVEENTSLDELLDRIGLRLGFDCVCRFQIRQSLLPESSTEFVPVTGASAPNAAWPAHRIRPLRLVEPPAPIEIAEIIPGKWPVRIRVGHQLHRIVRAEGPERLTSEWWRERPATWATRDYYRIEDDQGALLDLSRNPARGKCRALVSARAASMTAMRAYAELQASSNFSFLRGASHPQELMAAAATAGLAAIALTDRNTLSGIVLAHSFLKQNPNAGARFIVGCRLDLSNGESLLCYPTDRAAYGRLTRLLTLGKRRATKGECDLSLADVVEHSEGQRFVLPFPAVLDEAPATHIRTCAAMFTGRIHLALTHSCRGDDRRWIQTVAEFARSAGVPTVVTNDVLYHARERKPLQDVLTCIREGCTLQEAGFRLQANAERDLKSPRQMHELFAAWPDALEATLEIADACRFSLDELRYEYPEEIVEPGMSAFQALERRTWDGAAWRFPDGVPEPVSRQIRHELKLIEKRGYAPYFLTVHEIVKFATSKGILHQGRGSAANSVICFCLGITQVDPVTHGLLFERFISAARDEPPDIDVDFEHDRREEVIQHIYEKYGRDRAGITATVVHYRTRRAVREVGKALGLSDDVTGALAGSVWGWSNAGVAEECVREAGLDPTDRRLRQTLHLTRMLIGFPRHLSQHVGGFVMSRGRLDELVPIENAAMEDRTVIQWEKDDLDELGLMKVDILALGMLSAIRRAFELLEQHYDRKLTLATVPHKDSAPAYEMLQQADSIGVFQVESRAQQSMLPRLKPKDFYDLVIEVAIVRPGPIQGDMVHPYLRRREGKEPVVYPSPALEAVLKKTLGVPLFQEQAMQIAIIGAGFTPTEADQLRRALATFRHAGTITTFRDRFVNGMLSNGYPREFAERCFSQIEGFGTYGFPEAHAISFANLVYVSAWIKCHYPDVFCAALLNSQPMGFYAPAQLVQDARRHGVVIRPIDVNHSDWDCTLEQGAVRLGLRMAAGLAERDAQALVAARGAGYRSPDEIARRTGCGRTVLDRLAQADAFESMQLGRRQSLWKASALDGRMPPLFQHADTVLFDEPEAELPPTTLSQEVISDYRATGLSLREHPLVFLRANLQTRCVITAEQLARTSNGKVVTVAGLVLSRQQPMTAKNTVFLTLEDETGAINLIVWKHVHERCRRAVYLAKLLGCQGVVQREGQVLHVVANQVWDWSSDLNKLSTEAATLTIRSRDFH
jgi:error-prone DNA polymerase